MKRICVCVCVCVCVLVSVSIKSSMKIRTASETLTFCLFCTSVFFATIYDWENLTLRKFSTFFSRKFSTFFSTLFSTLDRKWLIGFMVVFIHGCVQHW